MEEINPEISHLIYGYIAGVLTEDEKKRLELWLADPACHRLFEQICDKDAVLEKSYRFDQYNSAGAWEQLHRKMGVSRSSGRKWWRYAAAIVLPLLVCTLAYRLVDHQPDGRQTTIAEEINPGVTAARIRLADGRVVDLQKDSAAIQLRKEGLDVKNENGLLAFVCQAGENKEIRYNVIETPRGGEYKVILPDGSRVWLNAESSLRFPTAFVGDSRKVSVTGEAYFEVVEDKGKPFLVEMTGGVIRVLGTVFNVRAYQSASCVTTLISGSVELKNNTNKVLLEPGQQGAFEKNGSSIRVKNVDVNAAIAWKNGYFLFDNMRFEDIMSELGRWYDVSVFFTNSSLREERFSVEMRRHENFQEVLQTIERTGTIQLDIQGRTVFVK